MKKVRNFKEKKKSNTALKLVIGLIVAFTMLFSAVSIFNNPTQTSVKYNGFKFLLNEDGLFLKTKGQTFQFYTYPEPLQNLTYDRKIDTIIQDAKMVYLTADQNDTMIQPIGLVQFHLANEFGKSGKFTQMAFTSSMEGIDLPVIDCKNGTESSPVLYFSRSNESGISLDGNCIRISGQVQNEFSAYSDRIIYGYLGVIE